MSSCRTTYIGSEIHENQKTNQALDIEVMQAGMADNHKEVHEKFFEDLAMKLWRLNSKIDVLPASIQAQRLLVMNRAQRKQCHMQKFL